MPTIIQESLYQTAMNVYADVEERVSTIARDALSEMLSARVEEREAFLPLFAEINAAFKATKDNPAKAADIGTSELTTQLALRGQAEKRPFKVHARRVAELRDTLALHDDDAAALYVLFCQDGQGKDKDGADLPARVASYPDYLSWLIDRKNVEEELRKVDKSARAYTRGGKRTTAHDALIAKRRADADARARKQLGTATHDFPRTKRGVEDALRAQHDLDREILLMREEMVATAEGRKVWTSGKKEFNAALAG